MFLSLTKQGLFGLTFGPMFGVAGYPSYFYLSYNVQLDDGVSPVQHARRRRKLAADSHTVLMRPT